MSEQTLKQMEQQLVELNAKFMDAVKSGDVKRVGEIRELSKQIETATEQLTKARVEANKEKVAEVERALAIQITGLIDASGLVELMAEDVHTVIWFREDVADGYEGVLINPEGWGLEPKPTEGDSRVTARKMVAKPGNRTRQRIGSTLLREHGLACRKGYYSKDGVPYQRPVEFPVALFDPGGYLIFPNETAMRSNPDINVGKQVSVPRGISKVPGYHACGHTHGEDMV